MLYARTQKFYNKEKPDGDDIIDVLFEHSNNTFIATFVGANNGLLQLTVTLVYDGNGNLETFQFTWLSKP